MGRGSATVHGGYARTQDSVVKVLQSRWSSMLKRCTPEHKHYASRYADRGIGVCKQWLNFTNFYTWAIGAGFDAKLSLDREHNDRGYSPRNCRWATSRVQATNRSTTRRVRCIDTLEEFESTALASESLGLNRSAVSIALRRNARCGGFSWEVVC